MQKLLGAKSGLLANGFMHVAQSTNCLRGPCPSWLLLAPACRVLHACGIRTFNAVCRFVRALVHVRQKWNKTS